MKKNIILISSSIILVVSLYIGYQKITEVYHIHTDLALFVDGEQFDFSQADYMTSTDICATDYNSNHTHLHDRNGSIVHIHKRPQTVSDFFTSIGFVFTNTSLTDYKNKVYTNTEHKKWQFFVNGVATSSLQNYIFQDLDQILLSYGGTSTQRITTELSQVTGTACVYSEKCPKPAGVVLPTERCGSDE